MKTFVRLPEMYEQAKARRLSKTGRVELLRVIEEPPYWFVRIVGFDEERDRSRFVRVGSSFGNGYWRFCQLDEAINKFQELADQPEALKEQRIEANLREQKKQRYEKLVREGKMQPFGKGAGK